MNIRLRFTLILGSLVLGFCIVLLMLRYFAAQAEAEHRADFITEQATYLQHWLNSESRSWQQEALFIATHESSAQPTDSTSLRDHHSTAWLLTSAGEASLLTAEGAHEAKPAWLPSAADFPKALNPDGGSFWIHTGNALYQIAYTRLANHAAADWLMLDRRWNADLMQQFGELAGGMLSFAATSPKESQTDRSYQTSVTLPGWDGAPIGVFVLQGALPNYRPMIAEAMLPTLLLIAFGFTLILGLALSLRRWVLHPLHLVQQSLASGESDAIAPLRERRDEMGAVANLLATSIAQRKALHESEANLQRALEERIRLGRDLHDSVIQSLYATGMGLSLAKNRLSADQDDVAAKLEHSRAALNETILDLRNFITGLEPEALKQQTFAQAVISALESAETPQPIQTTCEIDDELSALLSISQRANILQITREAVSNAVRHGHASAITVALRNADGVVEFEISDNGRGFDPKAGHGQGHGLNNLAGRAHDMGAKLTVDAQPGRGVRMKLTFQSPRPADHA